MCKEQLEFDIGVIKYYEFTISINMSYRWSMSTRIVL